MPFLFGFNDVSVIIQRQTLCVTTNHLTPCFCYQSWLPSSSQRVERLWTLKTPGYSMSHVNTMIQPWVKSSWRGQVKFEKEVKPSSLNASIPIICVSVIVLAWVPCRCHHWLMDLLHSRGVSLAVYLQREYISYESWFQLISYAADLHTTFFIFFPIWFHLKRDVGIKLIWVGVVGDWLNLVLKW